MAQINIELAKDWVNYAQASLQSRIDYTAESTAKVLASIQEISAELEDKTAIQPLIDLKADESTSREVLTTLKDVLAQLDVHDSLAQLIYPLFSALQFEDRTRQKLESIMGILTTWSQLIAEEPISNGELAKRLMTHVVAAEQQEILSRHFPEHIRPYEEASTNNKEEEIDLF